MPLKSQWGCWTCRLRKKKCDKGRPECSLCESLSITCYGYGSKPDWVDDEEKGRAVAEGLKEIVKQTWRRKRPVQTSRTVIKIAPKLSDEFEEQSSLGTQPSHLQAASLAPDLGFADDGRGYMHRGSASLMHSSTPAIPTEESMLLMLFLDRVFAIQYPMYMTGILEGRGWLLSLIFKNKVFYHAALALSAYHRRITLPEIYHSIRGAALVKQEKHLDACIMLIGEFTQNGCPYSELGVIYAVVQLVFYEVFTGNSNTWRSHLHAARSTYLRGYLADLAHFALSEKSRIILMQDHAISEYDTVVSEEVTGFRFLSSTIISLDIISSITTGTTPHLTPYHPQLISSDSQIKLEDVVGCKNWAMLQIGYIAALHDNQTRALNEERLDCVDLQRTAGGIRKEIEDGLARGIREGLKIFASISDPAFEVMADVHTLVTHIFALMALLYLHLVCHGFQQLELVAETISEATKLLQDNTSKQLLTAMVTPLFVIGCVARQGDEQKFFREVFSSPQMLESLTIHRERILSILEVIWTARQTTSDFAWKDCVELTKDVLLI